MPRSRSAARRSTRPEVSVPAIVGNTWHGIWIYLIAPPLGAIIGWLVHTVVVEGDTDLRDDFEEIEDELLAGGATDE